MEICEEVLGLLANLDAIAFQVTHLEVVGPLAILLNLADSYGAGREKVSSFLGVGTVEPGAEFIGRASRRPETDCVASFSKPSATQSSPSSTSTFTLRRPSFSIYQAADAVMSATPTKLDAPVE